MEKLIRPHSHAVIGVVEGIDAGDFGDSCCQCSCSSSCRFNAYVHGILGVCTRITDAGVKLCERGCRMNDIQCGNWVLERIVSKKGLRETIQKHILEKGNNFRNNTTIFYLESNSGVC
jgi:hypothetical protein